MWQWREYTLNMLHISIKMFLYHPTPCTLNIDNQIIKSVRWFFLTLCLKRVGAKFQSLKKNIVLLLLFIVGADFCLSTPRIMDYFFLRDIRHSLVSRKVWHFLHRRLKVSDFVKLTIINVCEGRFAFLFVIFKVIKWWLRI